MKIVSLLVSSVLVALASHQAKAADLPDPGGCHLETVLVSHNVYINDRIYFVQPRQRSGEIPYGLSIPPSMSTDQAALEHPELRVLRFDESESYTYSQIPFKYLHQDFSNSQTVGNQTHVRTVYWNLVQNKRDPRFRIRLTDIRDVYEEIEVCGW